MNVSLELHFIFDYIRMVCYAMIILTSLRNIVNKKFSSILFVGDIVISFAMFVSALNITTTQFNQQMVVDKVLTPASIIWAAIHYYEFIKKSDNTKDST